MGCLRKVVFLVLLLAVMKVHAQKYGQALVDSLQAQLPAASDEQKLKLYVQLMRAYNDFNRQKAFTYEQPALQLANKLKSETGSEAGLADLKNVLGRLQWREQKYDLALRYHNEAKTIFEHINDPAGVAISTRYIGQDYADGGHYHNALKEFFLTKSMYEKLNDRRNVAYTLDLIAWVYDRQGNYKAASQYSYSTLRIFEEIGDPNSIALAAAAVAEYAIHLGNYEEALHLFQRSGQLYRQRSDLINQAYNNMLIGKVHRLMGRTQQAIRYYDSALVTGKQINDRGVISATYLGTGDVYRVSKAYDKALTNYQSAAALFDGASKETELAHVYCMMGECYRLTQRYTEARHVFGQALTISQQLNNNTLKAEYYQGMEKLDSTLGDWQAAYQHHKEYTVHRDSVFNRDNIRSMVQLQLQHDFDKKEEATSRAQYEKDTRLRWQFLFLGIIALLVGVLAVVLYQSRKRVARINEQLQQKSAHLEAENHEKVSILKVVSHDLRAPFGKIKGLIELVQQQRYSSEAEKEQYFTYIRTSIDQGTYLIRQLLEAHAMHATPYCQLIDRVQFMHEFEQTVQGQLLRKQQQLQVMMAPDLSPFMTDPQLLTRILDNLVSNASKFSDQKKFIYLRVWTDNEFTHFSVRDEGPGISEEDQQKLFLKFQKLSAKPTAGEDSTGLGLSITKALVEQLNGTIEVHSTIGVGTEVVVRLRG